LERGANRIRRGHWEYKISLPETNEFGALAKAFNAMAENVKTTPTSSGAHGPHERRGSVGRRVVAHEINNPLTAVLGQTQILLAKIPETDPVFSSLKKIENGAIRCRKNCPGAPGLSHGRPIPSFEPVDLNTVVDSTLDLCEADLRKSKNHHRKKTIFLPFQ